jgi:hypothetical protein
MTQHAWDGYMKYAKGFDELRSTSQTGANWGRFSLLLTPIDAYDTLFLMGLKKEALQAKDLIDQKFNPNVDMDVSVFETTIRVLGGFLGAFTLDRNPSWLRHATNIADRLMVAFKNGPIPKRQVNLANSVAIGGQTNLAEVGSLQLEFSYLSQLTQDSKYANAANGVYDALEKMSRPEQGLFPIFISEFDRFDMPYDYGIDECSDSFYEYLLKMWVFTGENRFREMYDKFTIVSFI